MKPFARADSTRTHNPAPPARKRRQERGRRRGGARPLPPPPRRRSRWEGSAVVGAGPGAGLGAGREPLPWGLASDPLAARAGGEGVDGICLVAKGFCLRLR